MTVHNKDILKIWWAHPLDPRLHNCGPKQVLGPRVGAVLSELNIHVTRQRKKMHPALEDIIQNATSKTL
jgi:hypothetical protein